MRPLRGISKKAVLMQSETKLGDLVKNEIKLTNLTQDTQNLQYPTPKLVHQKATINVHSLTQSHPQENGRASKLTRPN